MATVQGSDIIVDNWAQNAVKDAESLNNWFIKLDKSAVDLATSVSNIKFNPKTAEGIKALTIALEKTSNARKDIIEIEKQQVLLDREVIKNLAEEEKAIQQANKAKAEEEKINQQALKTGAELEKKKQQELKTKEQAKKLTIQEVKEQERLNKIKEREAKQRAKTTAQLEKENNAYFKLTKRVNEAQANFKKLAAQYGVNSKQARKAQRAFDSVEKELRQINTAAKDGRRDVGRYGLALKGAGASLRNLASGLGIIGGIQLFTRTIRDSFNIIKNFDQSQADLASVLAVNVDEMAALTEQAKELGATTKFTASEVAGLQLEFAKLGFTQKEIQNVTESTLELAAAAGTDLANAATIVGSTLRGFNLDSSETQRLVDVMAQSFSSSSLDIDKFASAMSAVAPVANGAGVSVERTTALLGTLTDRGIDASTAGTGLRNMFLSATQAGLTFEEALAEVNGAQDKTAKSLELFGKRGATLGVILAENGASVEALTAKLEDSAGAAEEMADKQLNTLGGALDLLRSAWEGYILGVDGANGISDKFKSIIKFVAENLGDIIIGIGRIIKLWGAYTIAVKAANVASGLMNKRLLVKIRNFKILGVQMFKNIKSFGLLGLAITGAVMIVSEFIAMMDEGFHAQERFAKIQGDVIEQTAVETDKLKLLGKQLLDTNISMEERGLLLEKINAEYGTTLENLEDETEFVNQLVVAYKDLVAQLQKKITARVIEEELVELQKQRRAFDKKSKEFEESGGVLGAFGDIFKEESDKVSGAIAILEKELITLQNSGLTEEVAQKELEIFEETQKVKGKTVKDARLTELEEFKKHQEEILKQLEIRLRRGGADEEFIQSQIADRRIELARETGEKIIELNFEDKTILSDQDLEYLRLVDKNAADHVALEKKANEEINEDALKALGARIDAEQKLREKQEALRKKELAEAKEALKEQVAAVSEAFENIAELRANDLDSQIDAREKAIDVRQTEQQRLLALGTANSIEAAAAEEKAIAKEQIAIDNLQKEKRNLLIQITALQFAGQQIQQGRSLSEIGSDFESFFSSLPQLYDGSPGRISDTFGKTNTRDGHLMRLHDNEHVIGAVDSDKLHKAGIEKTSDIVGNAMKWQNRGLINKAMTSVSSQAFTDQNIVKKLDSVEKAISNIKIVQQHINLETRQEIIRDGNNITTIDHGHNPYRT